MLVLLFSIFLVSTIGAANQSIVLNCRTIRRSTCYNNNNIEISVQGMQIQRNDKTKYDTLFINGAKVKFLPTNIATTFPDLKVLKVVGSSLQEIEKSNFEGLNGITELNLEKNLIQILHADVFKALENLKRINLGQNKISLLPSKIFESNTKLVSISANGNMLKSISIQAFKNLVQLKSIYISNNQIEDLHSGTFDDCVELKTLSIHSNKLRYVPENIFNKNPNLEVSKQYFQNNTCIDEYLVYGGLSSLSDLTDAFRDNCRPHCYDKIKEMRKEIDNLTTQLNNANKIMSDLEDKICTQNFTLNLSEDELQNCKKRTLKVYEQNIRNQLKIEYLEENLMNLDSKLMKKQEKIRNLEQTRSNYMLTIENLNETIKQLNSIIDDQSNISVLREREISAQIFNDYNKVVQKYESERTLIAKEEMNKSIKNILLEKSVKRLTQENEKLKEDLDQMERFKNRMMEISNDTIDSLVSNLKNVTDINEELQMENRLWKSKVQDLTEKNQVSENARCSSVNQTVSIFNAQSTQNYDTYDETTQFNEYGDVTSID